MVSPMDDATGIAGPWPARRFDGRIAQAQPAWLRLERGWLSWWPAGGESAAAPQRLALSDVGVSERFAGLPRRFALPDGSTLVVDEEDQRLDAALASGNVVAPLPARMTSTRARVVACAIALVGLLVWVDRHGAGLAAEAVVDALPRSVDIEVGERAMAAIDQELKPSQIDEDRQARIVEQFHAVAHRLYPELEIQLEFRSRPGPAGVNAFALPDGTIVLLDGLVAPMGDSEVMAVLGHELSHVAHRHAMKAMARSIGLFTVAGAVFGDFSQVAATTVAGITTLDYGRDLEREADRDAIVFLRQARLPAQAWARALETLSASVDAKQGRHRVPTWLSSHPGDEERAALATDPR